MAPALLPMPNLNCASLAVKYSMEETLSALMLLSEETEPARDPGLSMYTFISGSFWMLFVPAFQSQWDLY